jgi:hypothetical protein
MSGIVKVVALSFKSLMTAISILEPHLSDILLKCAVFNSITNLFAALVLWMLINTIS